MLRLRPPELKSGDGLSKVFKFFKSCVVKCSKNVSDIHVNELVFQQVHLPCCFSFGN